MTLALRSPSLIGALVPVDNAPVDATLKSDFVKYIQGFRKIEDASVSNSTEADGILRKYEEVMRPSQNVAVVEAGLLIFTMLVEYSHSPIPSHKSDPVG